MMNRNEAQNNKGNDNWFFNHYNEMKERHPEKKRLLEDIFQDLYGDTIQKSVEKVA